MDSFHLHNIRMEKANAKLRYRRIQKITAMFRLMEFCIFLIIISRFTIQVPDAFKLSGEYIKGFFSVTAVLSPRFVFILGNAIVLVLFLKSGRLSGKHGGDTAGHISSKLDLYDEYIKLNSEKNIQTVLRQGNTTSTGKKKREQSSSTFTVAVDFGSSSHVVVKEENTSTSRKQRSFDVYNTCPSPSPSPSPSDKSKERKVNVKMHRSQSENLTSGEMVLMHHEESAAGRELRRSATVKYRGLVDSDQEKPVGSWQKEDEMSNEEFRRTVEAFIARQQRALREEEDFSDTSAFLPNIVT